MARETELGFKIKRVLSDNDQWKKIVKETEEFYDHLESNPLELNIGNIKHTVAQLQKVRSEYNKINNDASSNRGQIEFANTLYTVLEKAEGKFNNIGVMFKNVNDNTRKYVTGLSNIADHLADTDFGVKFLDVGAQFKELQDRAEDLYDILKSIGTDTYSNGEFSLWNGSFDKEDLKERIEVLRKLKEVQGDMLAFDPDMRARDFASGQSMSGLDDFIRRAQVSLELLRKSGLETTEELDRLRRNFEYDMDWSGPWDDEEFQKAKDHIADTEVYERSIKNLKDYISEREQLLEKLETGYERTLFTDDEVDDMSDTLRRELNEARDQFKVLQDLKGKNVGIDFTDVVDVLQEIKDAIREIKDAFDPLTQAFANEESAIHAMVTSNVSQLEELINKFKEVHDMVDSLNNKDFNITNLITQKGNVSESVNILKGQAKNLLDVVKQLVESQNEVYKSNNSVYQAAMRQSGGVVGSSLWDLQSFDVIDLTKKITKSGSEAKLLEHISTLEYYKDTVLRIVNEINKVAPNTIDTTAILSKLNTVQKASNESVVSSEQDEQAQSNIGTLVDKIKSERGQIEEELKLIRQQIENTFNFSTIDPDFSNVQTVTDKIYQQFVELQNKINALEIKLETPNMDGVVEAIKVIKQEGEAAENATPKKDAFTAANQKLADSMKETGDVGEAAVDGIKTEAEAAVSAYRAIANFSFKENALVSDNDFETFAEQIAANRNLKVKQARVTRGELGGLIGGSITFQDPKTLQEIQERYSVRPKEDTEDEVELYRSAYTLIENTAKAEQKAANEAERRKKAIADSNKWLIEQESLLTSQENKYKASSGAAKPLDGDTGLINTSAGVLPGIDKTIDGLAESIRSRINDAMGGVITQDLKNEIIKDLNTLKNEIQVQQARKYQSTTLRASSLETSRDVYRQYIDALEADSRKSGIYDQMSKTLTDLKTEVNSFTEDSFTTFLENVKKAQAKFKAEKSKYGQETQTQKQEEQDYNKLIQLQNKLYDAKKKLAIQEYGSVGEHEWQRKVDEAQAEYEIAMQSVQAFDKKANAIRREMQLQSEVNAVIDERIQKEEELAWTQREQEENARIAQETEAAYKERANAIKAEADAEKELVAVRKESDAFYQQEEKTRKAQEDAAWAEHRAEQEAAAEKERQINLAFSAKEAQEAAEAEKELAQARKAANDYFDSVGKQEKKDEEIKKTKELNALYRERNTIITAIIKYNNKASTLKTDKAIQRAKDQLELEKQRLAAIDDEIDKYGELINQSKLEQQNDRLVGRLRDSNVTNVITKEQKKDIEDVNRLLDRRKEVHDNILKLQKQMNSVSGDEEQKAIQKEIDGQNTIFRVLTKQLATYKDISLQRKVTEQDNKFREQDNWNTIQKNIDAASSADKAEQEYQKQNYKDILSLVEQLFDAQTALHKINTDSTGKVHTAEREKEIKKVKELSMLLKDIYGIDIKNLSGSLDKNGLLVQEQKNKLLEKEREYKQDIIDLTARAADQEMTAQKKLHEKENKKNQNYGKYEFNQATKFFDSMNANVRSLGGNDQISQSLNELVQDYTEAYKKIALIRKQFEEDPNAANDEGLKAKYQDAVLHASNLKKEIQGVFKETQKLESISDELRLGEAVSLDDFDPSDIKASMIAYTNAVSDGKAEILGFNAAGTEMYAVINHTNGVADKFTVSLDRGTNKLHSYTTGVKKASDEWAKFKKEIGDGVKRVAGMYIGFQEAVQAVRTGVNYVKEIDLAMTELKKVTDETDESYKQFLKDAGSTSAIIGSTISDFTEATATFARLGYSMEESSSMAETAIIYKNVADGLDSVEESSESIISTMMAFGIEANDTMSIIDRFNAVGNNFAITSAGIGEALQRSASALYSAGNTIDESVALVTAANSVIQNPEQVGTALKTLALRLRGAKTELEEAGLETDNMAESTSTLQAKLNALTHGKVDIMLDADTFKSTTQILREMSNAWEDMTDIERASALELMGGKRQANILSSVIQNFETVEDVIETSMNSSGSAMAENEKWLDSIEGKTYQFTNALQTMWSNMIDSEVIKGFLDFGTDAIQFLDTGAGKAIAFVAALQLMAKFKGFSIKGIAQGLGDTINKITTAQQTLQTLSQTTKVGQGYDLTNVNAYAQAVANLTAKQQANLLASQGLNQEQIRYALTLNQVDDAAMREAMAHVHATSAKQQENAVTAQSIQQKAQELAMSLRTQAATADETRAKELNVVADILENATSEEAIQNNLQEAVTSGSVSAALQAETTNTLGLTIAKKGLLATTKALMIANPVGFWLTVGTTILSLIPVVSSLVDAFTKSAEEIKQEAQEISQAYSDAVSEINSNLETLGATDSSSIATLEKEFERLTKGVDRYGNNISLTSDQYKRYKEICEQIVGINPSIARGYDSATEAIGNNASVLSQLIDLQKEEARFAAQEYVSDDNLETLSKDSVNDYIEARRKRSENLIAQRSELFGILNQGSTKETMEHILRTIGYSEAEIANTISKYFLSEVNDYDSSLFMGHFIDEINENAHKFDGHINELNDFFENYENTIESGEESVKKAQDGLIDKLLIVPKSDEAYDKLSSESKNFLTDWIKNGGIFKVDESTKPEDVQNMRDTILNMMDVLVSDTKNIEYKGEKLTAQDLIDKIYNLNPDVIDYQKYRAQINAMLEAFWNSLSEAQKEEYGFADFNSFKISFGFDFETEDDEIEKAKTSVAGFLKISAEEVQEHLDDMTATEIKAFYSVDWNAVGDDGVNTWQDVVDEMNGSTVVISDANTILTDLANTLDSIQSKYDTLQGAIDEFNECGAISGETLKSLIDNDLLQYLTFTENGLIADANAMQMLEQAAINEAYAMLNAAMVQDMENYALGKTEQMSALAQNAIGLAGSAAANAGAQAAQGAQGFLSFASAVAQAGIIDPGNLTAGLQQIYDAYQNIGNAIGSVSAYRPSSAYTPSSGSGSGSGSNSAKEIDWIEHYYTEIENKIDELNARLENKISNVQALDAKNTIIDQIIDLYDQKQQKLSNAVATYEARADYLFSTFSSDIQDKINNGSLDISSITDETLASNIEEYYSYIEAASQARVEAEELKQTIADLAKQKFDNISTAYENEISSVDAYIDALQDQIDATEARGEQVGASYYEGMIDSAEQRKQSLEEERNALQASLDEAVKLGQVEVGSDTWYEMVNTIYELDGAIVEAEISMEEWQTAINDLHWENFDKLIDKLENISDELDNIYERLTDNDEAFDEDGNWTNQGIAALGMLTQKMEQAQFAAQQYANQIDQLNADYAARKYSEEEYNEKLAELTEKQWEAIESYESVKDEIVDLNKARVDAVKDGMQKEIDAYKELIDAKKESLEADKKARDWANSIEEKENNIADIRRKLAALAGDNSTSAMAQKKKLQAELLKAQSELEEAYYDKSIEDQQDALDKEYENYEENQQNEMDSLEEWLDDREQVIQDSFDLVRENAQVVYEELLNLSQEYGIEISDEIIAPWLAGKDAIGEYKDAFLDPELNEATSAFISQLEDVKDKWEETASAAEEAADRQIAAVRKQQEETIAAYKEMQDSISTITIGSMSNVGYDDSGNGSGGGAGWGGSGLGGGTVTEEEVKPYSILEIFTNSLGKSYNKFLNDTAEDFDYKMSEAFIQNADQHNEEFKLRVPEEYKEFLQLVCDDLELSSTEGVELANSLSKVFALEDLPYDYKVFLANIVEGLVLAEEQGLEASDALSAIFASEDVPDSYKEFLKLIIGNLNEHILDGKDITYNSSEEWAKNGIPSEYQNYLDSIMQGLQAPVMEGTQDASNTSAYFFGSGLPEIINGVFGDVEAAAASDAGWASREMVRSTNNLWDNLVAWWNGVMDSLFGGSTTHTSSSGTTHGGSGGTFADGTAYADGNWGAPKTETSLVGELGPEILVRNGKWTTVGENGAEFTQVKKGDIIFNHKQAEQLLKYGHVTGRGKAYASGTWKNKSNLLDDLGEELSMCIGPNGNLQFLPNGTAAMEAGTIGNLTNLAQFDTTDILNRSRPSIGVSPSVANNTMEIKIDASVGELIHVDHLDGNNLDEIGKFVDKAWEKKMQTLNNSIKKFTR